MSKYSRSAVKTTSGSCVSSGNLLAATGVAVDGRLGVFIGSRPEGSKTVDMMYEEEGGERLVGAVSSVVGAGVGATSGVDTVFFSEVIAACGIKGVR